MQCLLHLQSALYPGGRVCSSFLKGKSDKIPYYPNRAGHISSEDNQRVVLLKPLFLSWREETETPYIIAQHFLYKIS